MSEWGHPSNQPQVLWTVGLQSSGGYRRGKIHCTIPLDNCTTPPHYCKTLTGGVSYLKVSWMADSSVLMS